MAKLKVAPTKSSLIKLRGSRKFVTEGHNLLSQKRDVLIAQMLQLVDQTAEHQKKFEETLAKGYKAFKKAMLQMGQDRVTLYAAGLQPDYSIDIRWKKIMGVEVPIIQSTIPPIQPDISSMEASLWLDEAAALFRKAVTELAKLAQLKITLQRLAREVKKTVRRVNALEKITMPDLDDTIGYIQNVLEENEREQFFVLKLVKKRLEAKNMEATV